VEPGVHTYVEDEGRGGREAPDADVRQHFEHVTFPACDVNESGRHRAMALRKGPRASPGPSSALGTGAGWP
jgi:hypothetical protein